MGGRRHSLPKSSRRSIRMPSCILRLSSLRRQRPCLKLRTSPASAHLSFTKRRLQRISAILNKRLSVFSVASARQQHRSQSLNRLTLPARSAEVSFHRLAAFRKSQILSQTTWTFSGPCRSLPPVLETTWTASQSTSNPCKTRESKLTSNIINVTITRIPNVQDKYE